MREEIWFRRNDGQEFGVNAGSIEEMIMCKNPLFTKISGPEGEELKNQDPTPRLIDLSGMDNTELLELAKTILGMIKIRPN